MRTFGASEWIILIVIGLVIFFIRKGSKDMKNTKADNRNNTSQFNTENKIPIPDICPHCKNPNTTRLRSCEWCGNQIY
jgi:hypothetical protein